MFDLNALVRNNIKNLATQISARDTFSESIKIFLDANENSFGSPLPKWYNRFPDRYQYTLKDAVGKVKGLDTANIFFGNGTEECIDLLFRIFCEPQKDNVIICTPADILYERKAAINNVDIRKTSLTENFQPDLIHLENIIDANTKLIWLCSPNDTSGISVSRSDIEMVLNNFNGIVVIDETYINFARQKSFISELVDYPNLVVLQTWSIAWGLAGLNLGAAFSSAALIELMYKIQPSFINIPTQELAIKALKEVEQVNDMIKEIVNMREALSDVLKQIPIVEKVYSSDANFLLVKFIDAKKIYDHLLTKGILVNDKSNLELCENCLRITIGTEKENTILIDSIADYLNKLAR